MIITKLSRASYCRSNYIQTLSPCVYLSICLFILEKEVIPLLYSGNGTCQNITNLEDLVFFFVLLLFIHLKFIHGASSLWSVFSIWGIKVIAE